MIFPSAVSKERLYARGNAWKYTNKILIDLLSLRPPEGSHVRKDNKIAHHVAVKLKAANMKKDDTYLRTQEGPDVCSFFLLLSIIFYIYPGWYTNKMFENMVNKLIFSDEKKLAKCYPEYFDNGVPLMLLAMIATMVCARHLYLF